LEKLKKPNASPTEEFEHDKGYAGSVAGKPRLCSEHVKNMFKPNFLPTLTINYHYLVDEP
jgi:hypothetical protein